MNLLAACRAGTCRRTGPREVPAVGDFGYHIACLVEGTWERTSERLPWQHLVLFRKAAP